MNKYKIRLDNNDYVVDVAVTEEEKRQGLKGRDSLPSKTGMLFLYQGTVDVDFTMQDVSFDIVIVLLDEMFQVVGYYNAEANDPEPFPCQGVHAVLELPAKTNIKLDSFMQIKEKLYDTGTMVVMDSNGEVQMTLKGGERIFSRKATKHLLDLVKKANQLKDSDPRKNDIYVDIGLFMFQEFNDQDNRDPEYVSSPT